MSNCLHSACPSPYLCLKVRQCAPQGTAIVEVDETGTVQDHPLTRCLNDPAVPCVAFDVCSSDGCRHRALGFTTASADALRAEARAAVDRVAAEHGYSDYRHYPAGGAHCICSTPNVCCDQDRCERDRVRELITTYRDGGMNHGDIYANIAAEIRRELPPVPETTLHPVTCPHVQNCVRGMRECACASMGQ